MKELIGTKVVHRYLSSSPTIFEVIDVFQIRKTTKVRIKHPKTGAETAVHLYRVRPVTPAEEIEGRRIDPVCEDLAKFRNGTPVVLSDEQHSDALLTVMKSYVPASEMRTYQLALDGRYITTVTESMIRKADGSEVRWGKRRSNNKAGDIDEL